MENGITFTIYCFVYVSVYTLHRVDNRYNNNNSPIKYMFALSQEQNSFIITVFAYKGAIYTIQQHWLITLYCTLYLSLTLMASTVIVWSVLSAFLCSPEMWWNLLQGQMDDFHLFTNQCSVEQLFRLFSKSRRCHLVKIGCVSFPVCGFISTSSPGVCIAFGWVWLTPDPT